MKDYKPRIKEFENLMHKHREYGATDSEPRYVFRKCMERFAKGREVEIPYTAYDWEIYSSLSGAEKVAKELGDGLMELVDELKQAPYSAVVDALKWYGFTEEY